MKFKALLLFVLFLFLSNFLAAQSAFDKMTNEKMNKILLRESTKVEGGNGNWQIEYAERFLIIITDENFNRMRIISPVVELDKIDDKEFKILLESNFDKALDAKYAIYNDVLWSTFTHPLGELTVEQLKDAMKQVATLSKTYGTTYTSTDFVFGGSTPASSDNEGN